MPLVWRLVKAAHATGAFDGEGARLYGGRWNSPGVGMVYTSDSLPLAALELLTQLNETSLLPKFVAISAKIPSALISELDRSQLPADWRAHPAPAALQMLGDSWIRSGRSLALRVPSALVPQQSNYLIHPEHPRRSALELSAPETFEFDLRLLPRLERDP